MADEAKKEEIKLNADQKKVMEIVEKMSVLDLSTLVKALEEKFGVSASAPMAVAAVAAPGAAAEPVAEKTNFDVVLTDGGAQKIAVIKAIKEATGLGLGEAKALVDGAPKTVKEAMPKAEAEALVKGIVAAGGKAEMK